MPILISSGRASRRAFASSTNCRLIRFSTGAAHTAARAMSAASSAGTRYPSTGESASAASATRNAVTAWTAISRFTRSVTTKGFLAFSRPACRNSTVESEKISARRTMTMA